jgi:hypothetical protein
MEIVVENSRQQIELMVDIVNLSIPKHKHLNEAQRRFFIENVLLTWRGIDISKKNGVEELKQMLGWKPNSRQVYKFRSELKIKGWMKKLRSKWVLPATFTTPFPAKLEVGIQIKRDG